MLFRFLSHQRRSQRDRFVIESTVKRSDTERPSFRQHHQPPAAAATRPFWPGGKDILERTHHHRSSSFFFLFCFSSSSFFALAWLQAMAQTTSARLCLGTNSRCNSSLTARILFVLPSSDVISVVFCFFSFSCAFFSVDVSSCCPAIGDLQSHGDLSPIHHATL